jgi:hypothetical protein
MLTHSCVYSARPLKRLKRPHARLKRIPKPQNGPSLHTCSSVKTGARGSKARTLKLVSVSLSLFYLTIIVVIVVAIDIVDIVLIIIVIIVIIIFNVIIFIIVIVISHTSIQAK